mgnify:CR=1 FL=1
MTCLYKRLLGSRYGLLPQAVQQLHDVQGEYVWHGRCDVKRGTHFFARILAEILSLPRSGQDIDVEVRFKQEGEKEHWRRSFGGRPFQSVQWQEGELLYERLNLTTLVFEVITSPERLSLSLCGLRVCGIPVLGVLRPEVSAEEREMDKKFHFTIHTTLPLIGLLVAYEGTLEPVN